MHEKLRKVRVDQHVQPRDHLRDRRDAIGAPALGVRREQLQETLQQLDAVRQRKRTQDLQQEDIISWHPDDHVDELLPTRHLLGCCCARAAASRDGVYVCVCGGGGVKERAAVAQSVEVIPPVESEARMSVTFEEDIVSVLGSATARSTFETNFIDTISSFF